MRRWAALFLFSAGCLSSSCDASDIFNPCPGHASPGWFVASSCDCPITSEVLSGAVDGQPCAPPGTDCFAGAVGPACACTNDGHWYCDAVGHAFDQSVSEPQDMTTLDLDDASSTD
ncbi:MAG TPA: hypothetical protein VIA18_09105 [Polyangia bacterium]|jgi:hypothetical protein|nr:hypothetical protein [Polyangia bacterium]